MDNTNYFIDELETLNQSVPLSDISIGDYKKAITFTTSQSELYINDILTNTEPINFKNTILAIKQISTKLDQIQNIINTNRWISVTDEINELKSKVESKVINLNKQIYNNKELYHKLNSFIQSTDISNLEIQDQLLIKEQINNFEESRVNLPQEKQDKLSLINKKLSELSIQFSKNIKKEFSEKVIQVKNLDDFSGMKESTIQSIIKKREENNLNYFPVKLNNVFQILEYCENRELREKVIELKNNTCTSGDTSNIENLTKIVNLRIELANIFGFETFAVYILIKNKRSHTNPDQVTDFLEDYISKVTPSVIKENLELQNFANNLGLEGKLEKWDERYHSKQLKSKLYGYCDKQVSEFFQLDRVKKGVFNLISRLYGISFIETDKIQSLNKDIQGYEIYDKDGTLLSTL